MNPAYKLTLVIDQIKTASVIFEEGPGARQYTYLTVIDDLEPGVEVIVETGADDTLKVATVVRVHDEPDINPRSNLQYRWILSTAGTTARAEQERLHSLEKKAFAILKEAERKEHKKRLAKELEELFGDSLKDAQEIDFKSGQPKLELDSEIIAKKRAKIVSEIKFENGGLVRTSFEPGNELDDLMRPMTLQEMTILEAKKAYPNSKRFR